MGTASNNKILDPMSSFLLKKPPFTSPPSNFAPIKKQGSITTRAKKFMASKAADSSMGRKTIVKFFGEAGESIVKVG